MRINIHTCTRQRNHTDESTLAVVLVLSHSARTIRSQETHQCMKVHRHLLMAGQDGGREGQSKHDRRWIQEIYKTNKNSLQILCDIQRTTTEICIHVGQWQTIRGWKLQLGNALLLQINRDRDGDTFYYQSYALYFKGYKYNTHVQNNTRYFVF